MGKGHLGTPSGVLQVWSFWSRRTSTIEQYQETARLESVLCTDFARNRGEDSRCEPLGAISGMKTSWGRDESDQLYVRRESGRLWSCRPSKCRSTSVS